MTASEPRPVAKVDHVDELSVYLKLPNGNIQIVPLSDIEDELQVGDVVLAGPKHWHELEVVPDELWPPHLREAFWIGVVVHLPKKREAVIDISGSLRTFRLARRLKVKVGNTVQGTESRGVTRVLSDKPLGRLETLLGSGPDVSRLREKPDGSYSYDQFAGYGDIKERTRDLIELPLLHRDKILKINAEEIRGVLFCGPSGVGKTMLGRIIAHQAKATFYLVSGPEIVSKYLGDSEEFVRAIFEDAKQHQPAIIFFDEIDSVAPQRSDESHEASRRLVGQLLTSMDGFKKSTNIIVIATTNRPQDIDVALRRPGRFDWEIHFPLPSREDREAILAVSAERLNADRDLPHAEVAARTPQWSPAELTGIWRNAAHLAVKEGRDIILTEDYLGGFEIVAKQRRERLATQKRNAEREVQP